MDYRQAAIQCLDNPFDQEWRGHGLGMLKTYLGPDVRLNLWHSRLVVPGVSAMHTHPWDLRSHIIAGRLTNVMWDYSTLGEVYYEGKINCCHFQGIEGDPEAVMIAPRTGDAYLPGQGYMQKAHEIHHTEFLDGTATIMTRVPAETGGYASVFWPVGETYGDATRPIDKADITETISAVRRMMGL